MDRTSSKQRRIVGAGLLSLAIVAGISYAAAAPSAKTAPPTWTALYRKYLAGGTVGDCATCHSEAATSDQAYEWLAQQQYMNTTGNTPYLIDPRTSCFSWLGGDMPPDGPSSYARARRDFRAWVDAGANRD